MDLKCPNCGASSNPDDTKPYVNCDYCNATISVTKFFETDNNSTFSDVSEELSEEEKLTISRTFKAAQRHLNVGDHKKAQALYQEILELDPELIAAGFNLALCELYSGEGNALDRARTSAKWVSGFDSDHEMNPELHKLLNGISFNVAAIGEQQINGFEAIEMFGISKELVLVNEERDELIDRYLNKLHQSTKAKFEKDLDDKGANFCPNVTALKLLSLSAPLNQNMASLGGAVYFHISSNTKKMSSKIVDASTTFKNDIFDYCPENFEAFKLGWLGVKKVTMTKEEAFS